jgi:hypothetical protein
LAVELELERLLVGHLVDAGLGPSRTKVLQRDGARKFVHEGNVLPGRFPLIFPSVAGLHFERG